MNEKIERTRQYLLESNLPEDTKDGLQDLLDRAGEGTNGTTDKIGSIAKAMEALAIHTVKAAVRHPDQVKAAVAAHSRTCPFAVTPGGKFRLVYWFRWPICVAVSVLVLSPNFRNLPTVLTALKEFLK
jgi:hypothetical protein